MNKAGIESALQNVAANVPELPFEELAALPYHKMEEHDYITRQTNRKAPVRIGALSLAAACSLAVLFLISGWYLRNRVSDSVITIDVNPSIQIITNRKDKILSVTALNEDARSVIAGNDYSGEKLEDTVDVLMNSLVEQQYIREDQKAILLTVTNKNADKADKIRSRADAAILNSLEAQNIKPTILSQIISREKSRTKLAGKYNISEGKLKLIQDMISVNSGLSLDLLAQLPIEKLLQLADGARDRFISAAKCSITGIDLPELAGDGFQPLVQAGRTGFQLCDPCRKPIRSQCPLIDPCVDFRQTVSNSCHPALKFSGSFRQL
jgi:hypothetical protein